MYSNGRKHRSNTRQIFHERVPDATLLTVVFFTTGGGAVIKSIGNILLRSLHHWSTSPAKYHWKKVFSNFQIIKAINFLEENLARFWFSCLHKSYPIHNEHTVSPTPVKPRDTDTQGWAPGTPHHHGLFAESLTLFLNSTRLIRTLSMAPSESVLTEFDCTCKQKKKSDNVHKPPRHRSPFNSDPLWIWFIVTF